MSQHHLATGPIGIEPVGIPRGAVVNGGLKGVGSGAGELVSTHKEKTIHLIRDVVACKKVDRQAEAVGTKWIVKVIAVQVSAKTLEHSITA